MFYYATTFFSGDFVYKSLSKIGTEIEEIIFVLTIATRYERCQKNASCKFKNYLDKIVLKAEQLNFELYGFNEKEIDIINTDIVEAKAVINR